MKKLWYLLLLVELYIKLSPVKFSSVYVWIVRTLHVRRKQVEFQGTFIHSLHSSPELQTMLIWVLPVWHLVLLMPKTTTWECRAGYLEVIEVSSLICRKQLLCGKKNPHVYNPSTQGIEAGQMWLWGQPGLHSKTLSSNMLYQIPWPLCTLVSSFGNSEWSLWPYHPGCSWSHLKVISGS